MALAVVGYIWSGFEAYTILIGVVWAVIGMGVYYLAQARGRQVKLEV